MEKNLKDKNLAIANRSCVSFVNTNRSHNLATSEESRRYIVAFNRFAAGGIWLRQESLETHFGLTSVRPWDNRGKCHMDEKKI